MGAAGEGAPVFRIDLLEGASDVEGDALNVVNVTGLKPGITQDGNELVVDPTDPAFEGLGDNDSFETVVNYVIVDGNGGSVSQSAKVTIAGDNNNPTVVAQLSETVPEGSPVFRIDLLEGAGDAEGDELNVANVTGLKPGIVLDGNELVVDPSDQAFDGLGDGQSFVAVVSYDIEDGNGGSVSQSAKITVSGENDDPKVAAQLMQTAAEDSAVFQIDLLDGASDAEGQTLSVVSPTGLGPGMSISGNTLTVDPSAAGYQSLGQGVPLVSTVNYNIIDSQGGSVSQSAKVTITGVNDKPVVAETAQPTTFTENGAAIIVDSGISISDIDSAQLTGANRPY